MIVDHLNAIANGHNHIVHFIHPIDLTEFNSVKIREINSSDSGMSYTFEDGRVLGIPFTNITHVVSQKVTK